MALYLTYRPKTFDEVLFQDHVTNILRPKVISGDNSHSNFILYGPRGTGKTSTARIFAKALNCINPNNGNPCNTCENCTLINSQKAIDLVEIDAASHTGVDNVREEIIGKAEYPPVQLPKKVYIIDEVHMLSKPAFNALLKIMEEPPHYLVFILATTDIHKIPETIISRCQVFTLKKIPVDILMKHLSHICEKEGFTYTDEALMSIAKISDGCARDAVKYLDQVSILGDITQDHVSSFLGVASQQLVETFLQGYINNDNAICMQTIDTIQQSGIDVAHFIKQCLVYIEEHFSDNMDGYSRCISMLNKVHSSLRSFPLHTLLLKAYIVESLSGTPENKQTDTKHAPAPTSISHTPQPSISSTTDLLDGILEDTTTTHTTISDVSEGGDPLKQIALHPDTSPSIKSILNASCLLDQSTSPATLYVFNKLQAGILQKPETWAHIEKTYKNLTGSSVGPHVVITTREEYFSQKI